MDNTIRVIEKTKIWFAISLTIIIIGIAFMGFKGLNYGIDFKSGSLITVDMNKNLTNSDIEDVRVLASKYDANAEARIVEKTEVSITSATLTDEQIKQLYSDIKTKYNLKDETPLSTERLVPSVGKELTRSALISSIIAIIGILIYVTIRFEFKSGIAAIVALIHDLLIMITVYVVFQLPINSSFIAAILTILGYSINDTIVVFDRIRENKKKGVARDFNDLVDISITQTMVRSINTSLTTLFTITAIYVFGVSSIKDFAFPLIIGLISGCYSSVFIASPVWALLEGKEKKKLA